MKSAVSMGLMLIFACASIPAHADDKADCENAKLPAEQVLQACRRYVRSLSDSPVGETQVIGTFDGCDIGKKYPLMNGYTLECRMFRYHTAESPNVLVESDTSVIIDGDRYDVSIK